MPPKPSVIRCPKCGYEPNILTDTCMNCGGKLAKLCGACGFSNAVEKNYCDQCGGLLTMKSVTPSETKTAGPAGAGTPPPEKAPAPRLEIQPIQETVNEKESSYRSQKQPGYPSPAAAAQAVPPVSGAAAAKTWRVSLPGDSVRGPSQEAGGQSSHSFTKNRPSIFGLVAAAVALAAAYLLVEPHIPGFMLKRTANSYLQKLSSGRYREAYNLLSTNSKSVCSVEDYIKRSKDYYSKFRWEFKDIEIFATYKNAAMIKYQLREAGKPWQTDYISFVNENGKWTRPYIWLLFGPIDSALERQDYPQALFLAQKLYLTDPIDPRTSGYLCSSEFFMGIYNKAEESCLNTLNAAKIYPVGFSQEETFWYRFYYAESLRMLEKYEPAISEYDDLLASAPITAREQCPLHISRADAFIRLKKYDDALDDAMKADSICFAEDAKKTTGERLRFLNGDAKPEAIAFVQRSRLAPDQPTILEARKREVSDRAAKAGAQKQKTRDSWVSAHIAGPEYRVILRETVLKPGTETSGTKDLMIFRVNLWTARAQLEKGAPPATPPEPAPPARRPDAKNGKKRR